MSLHKLCPSPPLRLEELQNAGIIKIKEFSNRGAAEKESLRRVISEQVFFSHI